MLISNDSEVGNGSSFFNDLNRSKLINPSPLLVNYMKTLFGVFTIMKTTLIDKKTCPRSFLVSLFLKVVEEDEKIKVHCTSGHTFCDLLEMAAKSFTNCLLKNYVRTLAPKNLTLTSSKKIKKLNSNK